ncbi:MAG: hypothetical protein PGN34_17575 [Methylobacterium frigidaeris]
MLRAVTQGEVGISGFRTVVADAGEVADKRIPSSNLIRERDAETKVCRIGSSSRRAGATPVPVTRPSLGKVAAGCSCRRPDNEALPLPGEERAPLPEFLGAWNSDLRFETRIDGAMTVGGERGAPSLHRSRDGPLEHRGCRGAGPASRSSAAGRSPAATVPATAEELGFSVEEIGRRASRRRDGPLPRGGEGRPGGPRQYG